MKTNIPWALFTKLFRGELTPREAEDLELWQNTSTLNQKIHEEILDDDKIKEVLLSNKWENNSLEWEELLTVIKPPVARISFPRQYMFRVASVAAIFLLLLGSSLGFLYERFQMKKELAPDGFTYIFSPRGQRTSIILPDETKVWLNSESSLKYAVGYNKKIREVYLKGEAFFEVKKNLAKPFFVYANEVKVKVYGTSFNIKAFPNEKYIETTLIEGKLSITPEKKEGSTSEEIFLKPKEKCIYTRESGSVTADTRQVVATTSGKTIGKTIQATEDLKIVVTKDIDPEPEVLWKEGKLIFIDETFGELAVKMERWYDMKIHFKDEKIKNYKFTGVFYKETINQAMEALRLSSQQSYQYEIVFRDIYLKSK